MSAADYLLPKEADERDLSKWSDMLPPGCRIISTNLFGDVFLVDAAGAVHMLERGSASISQIAGSEEQFWRELTDDADGWQLRPLVDACRASGKVLGAGQCNAFTTPRLLGGAYVADNIWVAPWSEWFSLTANLHQQTMDSADGSTVNIKVVD
jgi:hypothetical protein